ncbi:carbohydrate-binding module family 48 protein [Canariomyces notabilis]|uniref:Carbohydrate-binding module family 48 protein n=1 Tax=Canariomyces notabilis TaxID=2074819 RepID=A0AAN6TIC9_9PEZI|nr:carbohydrate-binding module family 48 protein [Canariomyces arenarius]
MGNSPSTSKSANQSSGSNSQTQHDRPVRRDNRHPIPVQTSRVAAPPEPSLTQAQGTSVQPPSTSNTTGSRTKPLQFRQAPSSAYSTASSSVNAASSSSSAKPVEVKQPAAGSSHQPSKPVAVPNYQNSPSSPPRSLRSDDTSEAAIMPHSSLQDMSYLTRPPRLPLPIEEEVHTPGSPIIAPADAGQPLEDIEGLDSAKLSHPGSDLSNTSAPGEEDTEELLVDKTRPTVPTRLEWRHGGDKVYVTGTIFQWNRKTRLHPVPDQPGVFATTINILPGTHHIRFLVDNQMQTSPDYPTTVDFGNNLVNYIEVSPDDVPAAETEAAGPTTGRDGQQQAQGKGASTEEEEDERAPRYREVPPAEAFVNKIPKYLLDLDQPEDSPLYHSAFTATEGLPNPPALPGFLNKPILNASTLMKDDNSVLNMPNHTVLNHLATSSIKNNVLAVSATTRYKSKYVTTIMYKPTTAEGI